MFVVLSILMILMAVVLVFAVLLQPSKGGDLSGGAFGGVGGQMGSMFGMRRAADFLQKFTIGMAGGILFLAIVTNKFFLPKETVSERVPVTVGSQVPAPAPQQQLPPADAAPADAAPADAAPVDPAEE